MKSKPLKKLLMIIAVIIAAFFVLTEACIYYYLKSYGYGIKELPQTTLVYFHLSKGFSVGKGGAFIGRHSHKFYDELFEKRNTISPTKWGWFCIIKRPRTKMRIIFMILHFYAVMNGAIGSGCMSFLMM